MYYQGYRDFIARCGELFAGYIAGTFASAVALIIFQLLRDWQAQFDLTATVVITLITFAVGLFVVPWSLLPFVLVAEAVGIRSILYYMFSWGLIGYMFAEGGTHLPAIDWFQRHSSLIFFRQRDPRRHRLLVFRRSSYSKKRRFLRRLEGEVNVGYPPDSGIAAFQFRAHPATSTRLKASNLALIAVPSASKTAHLLQARPHQ